MPRSRTPSRPDRIAARAHRPGTRRGPIVIVSVLVALVGLGATAYVERPGRISWHAPRGATRAAAATSGPVGVPTGAGVPPAIAAGSGDPTSPRSAPSLLAPATDVPIIAPSSFSGRRAPAVAPPPALVASGPKEAGVWAIVVGINDYPGDDHDLTKAVADARDMDAALAGYGVAPSHRLLLLDGQASSGNLRRSLAWLVAHAAPDATAVVFFSGHVAHVADGPRGASHVALLAADGTGLTDREIARSLDHLEAHSAWIAIAACYGAEFDTLLAPGRVLTAAAGRGQLAYENTALDHSYFVEYMIQRAMVEGHAADSVQGAFGWARAQIAHDYPNRQPVMIDRTSGLVSLRQAGSEATPPKTPRGAPAEPDGPRPGQPSSPRPDRSPRPAPQPSPPPPSTQPPCTALVAVTLCHPTDHTPAVRRPE